MDTTENVKTEAVVGNAADVEHAEHVSRAKRLSRVTRVATLIGATAAVICATVLVTHEPSRSDTAAGTAKSGYVIVAHSSDRHPSQAATDWVTYADHVVAVTPVAEKEISPTGEEIERGEGLILRNVTLRVDGVLWSRSAPDKPAPTSFEWVAHGWQFTDGDTANRTRMTGEHQPRIELGHSYVMAIEWQEPVCAEAEGDDRIPGQWRGLGSDSNIPFDGQVLGQGESEGKVESAARARAATEAESDPDDPNYSLKDQLTGQGAPDLIRALQDAEPATNEAAAAQSPATACE
ncbi:hypothetical protein ACWCQB_16390 [Streptomyces hirsutus]